MQVSQVLAPAVAEVQAEIDRLESELASADSGIEELQEQLDLARARIAELEAGQTPVLIQATATVVDGVAPTATLSWQVTSGAHRVTGFIAQRGPHHDVPGDQGQSHALAAAVTSQAFDLHPGGTYWLKVLAYGSGAVLLTSALVEVTVAPAPEPDPIEVTSTATVSDADNTATLVWAVPSGIERLTGFKVRRSAHPDVPTDTGWESGMLLPTDSSKLFNLRPGNSYTLTVDAYDAEGVAASANTMVILVPDVTNPPAGNGGLPADVGNWVGRFATDFDSKADWGVEDGTVTYDKAPPTSLVSYDGQTQGNDNSVNMARNALYVPTRGLVLLGKRESGLERPFSSAEVVGTGANQTVPNYFRARVVGTFKDEGGIWPCLLWFRPVGASDGEIDVMEWMGGYWSGTQKRVAITMHNEYGATQDSIKKPLLISNNPWYDPNVEHEYVIEKVPGSIKVWVDGRLISTFTASDKAWWNRIMEVAGRMWYPRFTLQIGQGASTQVVPNPASTWQSCEVVVRSYETWTLAA